MNALPESAQSNFVVMQPGSTVATALVEGEARKSTSRSSRSRAISGRCSRCR